MHVSMHMEEGMATTPVFLLGESHGQRSLVGYRPQGRKDTGSEMVSRIRRGLISPGPLTVCLKVNHLTSQQLNFTATIYKLYYAYQKGFLGRRHEINLQ